MKKDRVLFSQYAIFCVWHLFASASYVQKRCPVRLVVFSENVTVGCDPGGGFRIHAATEAVPCYGAIVFGDDHQHLPTHAAFSVASAVSEWMEFVLTIQYGLNPFL